MPKPSYARGKRLKIFVRNRKHYELIGDFESPNLAQPDEKCIVSGVHRHPTSNAFTVRPLFGQNCVAAVWDSRTGQLLWSLPKATEFGWSADGQSIYGLFSMFGRSQRNGIRHRLDRYSWPECKLQEESFLSVPSGGADSLIMSPQGRYAAVVAIQSPEWYYEVLELQPKISQLWIGQRIDEYLLDGPVFSPDDRYLVTIASTRYAWWAWPDEDEEGFDEENWHIPSEGGQYECGWIYVHDLESNRFTKHTLNVNLPQGWLPTVKGGYDDGWNWMVIWGPEFINEKEFRVWLPGGHPFVVRFPLPEQIDIELLPNTFVS